MVASSVAELSSNKQDLTMDPRGQRLLPNWIDHLAKNTPDKIWASMPWSSNLEDGFRDLQYRHLAGAIDKVAWWIESKIGRSSNFETVAFIGYEKLLAW